MDAGRFFCKFGSLYARFLISEHIATSQDRLLEIVNEIKSHKDVVYAMFQQFLSISLTCIQRTSRCSSFRIRPGRVNNTLFILSSMSTYLFYDDIVNDGFHQYPLSFKIIEVC